MAPRPGAGTRGRRGRQDRGQAARRPAGQSGGGEPPLIDAVTEAAPAKVNLFLHVTGRRADGYHLLDSLVVFADVADELRAERAQGLSLVVDGPEWRGLAGETDNLVLRAARGLATAAGVDAGAALRLTKRLPVASGIGGGSADAAAALRALGFLWGTPFRDHRVDAVAQALGADVPACVNSLPVRMSGIGEVMRPAPCVPEVGMVLVNPRIALPTPAVFARRSGPFSAPATLGTAWSNLPSFIANLAAQRNDLEAPAIALCPPIAEVLAALRALPGCLLARMSGSGATCFAIFPTPEHAQVMARSLPAAWWHWGGTLFRGPLRLS